MNDFETLPLSKFRQQTEKLLDSLPQKKGYLLLSRSRPKGFLIDVSAYKKQMELVEDLTDALELERARGEKSLSFKYYLQRRYGNSTR